MRDTASTPERAPGILILTHGPLGPALLDSARLVIGDQPGLRALALLEGCDVEEYAAAVSAALDELGDGTLVLADLFGGTPFNQVVLQMDRHAFVGVAGVNLPMLIEAASLRHTLAGPALAEAVRQAGLAGIADINGFVEKIRARRRAAAPRETAMPSL